MSFLLKGIHSKNFIPMITIFFNLSFFPSDINECKQNASLCGTIATCRNTQGSYQCDCGSGYKSINSLECVNVDECSRRQHACHRDAICSDSHGSYTCTCKRGYVGDGTACQEDHRCTQMSEGGCRFGEICAKLHGVFECIPIARTTDHPSGKGRHYFAAFSSGSPNFSYQNMKYYQAASNPSK